MWLAESWGTTHENLSDENHQSHPQKHQCLISSTSCCCNDVRDFCFELPESTPCFCQSPWSVLQKSVGRTYQKPNVFPHFSHTNQHQPLGTGPRSLVPGSWTGQWRDRFFFPVGWREVLYDLFLKIQMHVPFPFLNYNEIWGYLDVSRYLVNISMYTCMCVESWYTVDMYVKYTQDMRRHTYRHSWVL